MSCPACGSARLSPFYRHPDLPLHSTLLMPTRERALDYPRGDLELTACEDCGFISNQRFQRGLHEYSAQCEESQGCSPTFSAWLEALAARLVRDYDVRGRRVLEIGSGKGEFLASLCRQGHNTGIAYDPAYVPGRLPAEAERPIDFHARLWDESRTNHGADVVACRHTLEHIPDVRHFLQQLRRAMGDKPGQLLFLEVPDTLRVLAEGAFWDIYYEHCSYFTQASLENLVRRCGFNILESWLDYDDQYLLLTAEPAAACEPGGSAAASEALAAVARFEEAFARVESHWRDTLARCHRHDERVVLWGGGSKATAFLNLLDRAGQVAAVIDINPHKQGAFIPGTGHPVLGPGELARLEPDLIILMNPIYQEEVAATLSAHGCHARLEPL